MRRQMIALAALAVLSAAGCSPVANDNESAVTLHANFGKGPGQVGIVGVTSDVVDDVGASQFDSYDLFVASVAKNPNAILSDLYVVEYKGYAVSFSRPDGRNEPGVDVPFGFTRAIGGSIEPGGVSELNIIFITPEMKVAPPLRNLFFSANQRIYATLHVTIFGRDRVENDVAASAALPITFADF